MSTPPNQTGGPRGPGDSNMSRTYVSVFLVWVLVLGALFAFQSYFTH